MAQLIPQDERTLPAFASLKPALGDGLIDLSSADTGNGTSFGDRKSFAQRLLVLHC